MYNRAKQFTLSRPKFKKILGVLFVIIGIIAIVAPVVPGAPVVFIGLELLGLRFLFLDKILKRKPETKTEPEALIQTSSPFVNSEYIK